MSQDNVERIVGRLATDEDFRRSFHEDPAGVVRDLVEHGLALTRAELAALVTLDPLAFDRLADALDPRLQKASLRGPVPGRRAAGGRA